MEVLELTLECFALIGIITGALIWYAVAFGRREDREAGRLPQNIEAPRLLDPDAHLGHSGAE